MTFDEWYSKEGFSYQRIEKVLMEKAWHAARTEYVHGAPCPGMYRNTEPTFCGVCGGRLKDSVVPVSKEQ